MANPYREAAFVERVERGTFRYVVRDDLNRCPICRKSAPLVRYCDPFSRIVVSRAMWWAKLCPLPGVHWHEWCERGAHIVGGQRAVEVKEEPCPKETP